MIWVVAILLVATLAYVARVSKQITDLLHGVARMNRIFHDRLDAIEDHMGKPRSDRGRAKGSPADRLAATLGIAD